MLEIIFLSITQGITEFLPISSSAHLILISKYFSLNNESLTIDISLHLGSLLAVLYFFKHEIVNFINHKSLFIKIIIGSIPTITFGFILVKLDLIEQLRNIYIISLTTIIFGIILFIADRSKAEKNINSLNLINAFYIGLLQAFSLIPGVSRSGITITAARLLNYNRIDSAKISFLFSIPILISASSYAMLKVIEAQSLMITIQNFWGIFYSFIFSLITLRFFLKFLKKFSMTFFVIYRIALGIILLIYVYK